MMPQNFGRPENIENPEQPPKPARQVWISLGVIVASVVLTLVVLTLVAG